MGQALPPVKSERSSGGRLDEPGGLSHYVDEVHLPALAAVCGIDYYYLAGAWLKRGWVRHRHSPGVFGRESEIRDLTASACRSTTSYR